MKRGTAAIGLWLVAVLGSGIVVAGGGFVDRFDASDQQLLDSMDKFQYYGIYQRGTCFSDIEQPAAEYPESQCISHAPGSSVLIVGDSFAAHLYPGLAETLAGTDDALSQATKASCSYLTPDEQTIPSCKAFRDYVVADLIPRMKPDLIIYSELWGRTEASPDRSRRLESAIAAFAGSGAEVVVAGPTPRFFGAVPKSLVISGNHRGDRGDVWLPCIDDSAVAQELAAATRAHDVELVAMDTATRKRAQSSPDGLVCLAATADGPLHWDSGHLTQAGSELYGAHLWAAIAGP